MTRIRGNGGPEKAMRISEAGYGDQRVVQTIYDILAGSEGKSLNGIGVALRKVDGYEDFTNDKLEPVLRFMVTGEVLTTEQGTFGEMYRTSGSRPTE
ncbi:MAG: hypothetical protein ISS48_04185 [Candidatus Aenigmarchaeota archaeon]|nr:hypothetical protein [Candidatus Aenigmarchaeota archaeon]